MLKQLLRLETERSSFFEIIKEIVKRDKICDSSKRV